MRGQQDFVEKQNKTIVEREKTMQIIYCACRKISTVKLKQKKVRTKNSFLVER